MLEIVKDPISKPTDLANAASESVLGASNAGAGDPQRRRPWGGAGAGGARGGGRRPGTWERELVEDASSTSGELANAASEHIHGVRNAGEAIRGLPALTVGGSLCAAPTVGALCLHRCLPRLPFPLALDHTTGVARSKQIGPGALLLGREEGDAPGQSCMVHLFHHASASVAHGRCERQGMCVGDRWSER